MFLVFSTVDGDQLPQKDQKENEALFSRHCIMLTILCSWRALNPTVYRENWGLPGSPFLLTTKIVGAR